MIFNVTKSNDSKYKQKIELNTLEDLINFKNTTNGNVILKHIQLDDESEIEISTEE